MYLQVQKFTNKQGQMELETRLTKEHVLLVYIFFKLHIILMHMSIGSTCTEQMRLAHCHLL